MLPIRLTRRALLKAGANATAGAAVLSLVPRPLQAHFGGRAPEPLPPIQDAKIKELAFRAITASRAAGADYADVRLTHDRRREIERGFVMDQEKLYVGVRALVGGSWGFATSGIWSPDEMARLGQEAAAQARAVAGIGQRSVSLAPVDSVAQGHWTTPIQRDPFEVSPFEIMDFMTSVGAYTRRFSRNTRPSVEGRLSYAFTSQAKAFASTEGSYCTQQLYRSEPTLTVFVRLYEERAVRMAFIDLHQRGPLMVGGGGWELWDVPSLREAIRSAVDEGINDVFLPVEEPEVGRYDTAISSYPVAELAQATLGRPTELDRALGYEANATGTSYLNDPVKMIDNYRVGVDFLTVTANRTDPGGCATVKWDDEGVAPTDMTLVRDGIITDFQTTRESAGELKGVPGRQQPARSHGCAYAPTAYDAPLTHVPNLAIAPGPDRLDFDDLVGKIDDGIAVKNARVSIDFQGLNGSIAGVSRSGVGGLYRVKGGKIVSQIRSPNLLFRSPELWQGLLALGGPASVGSHGLTSTKGEPTQESWHTVKTPPALFKQLTLIDGRRKS